METQVAESIVSEFAKACGIPRLEFLEQFFHSIVPPPYINEFVGAGMFDINWDLERFRTEKCRTCKCRIVENNTSYCKITIDKRYKNGLHRVKARRESCYSWQQK